MERYFILKHQCHIQPKKPYIDFNSIPEITNYITTSERSDALHFDIPTAEYKTLNKAIELKFLTEIVSIQKPKNYESIEKNELDVCMSFREILHPECFNRLINNPEQRRHTAMEAYFNKMIK